VLNQLNDIQVLVVGAGPTGLTLAIDLARRGVSCRVIDKASEPFGGSRGKGLQPRTLEVFDDLGVIDAVLDAGAPYPPLRGYAADTVIFETSMHQHREPTPQVPYPNVLMVPQWRTEQILHDRLAGLGGRVEFGTALVAFEPDEDGVTAALEAPDGTPQRARAAYLVGADGGRSLVRKPLAIGFEGQTHEAERMLIGDVYTDDLDHEHAHVWADMHSRQLRVALWAMPGTDAFQFIAPLAADEEPELSLESYQGALEAGSGRSDVRLREVSCMSMYRVNIRMAERFRAGRVFLAGDAAHVHSPAGGQGLNTGVQDAYNLGWKLDRVLGGASAALLDTYEEERLPVAAGVLGISTRLYRKAAEGQAEAFKRDEETEQLNLAYRDSSLSHGARGGQRAPDAPLQDASGAPTRLFELFRGPHLTLLAFGTGHTDTINEITARYGATIRAATVVRASEHAEHHDPGHLTDIDGCVHAAYHPDGGELLLVRPDGYIGYHGEPAGLSGYLAQLS
jgi:2-polyprenyl-6-methoxyphenol hydroxylase-like FAD-dependent oxidoreductase